MVRASRIRCWARVGGGRAETGATSGRVGVEGRDLCRLVGGDCVGGPRGDSVSRHVRLFFLDACDEILLQCPLDALLPTLFAGVYASPYFFLSSLSFFLFLWGVCCLQFVGTVGRSSSSGQGGLLLGGRPDCSECIGALLHYHVVCARLLCSRAAISRAAVFYFSKCYCIEFRACCWEAAGPGWVLW